MNTRNPTCGACSPCLIPIDCSDCCRCIPRRICVEVQGEDYGCCGTTKTFLEWDDYTSEYSGGVCGIDLRFYYGIDDDDNCALFLESYCAGLTGDYALSQAVDCHDMENLNLSYSVDTYGCDDCGEVTLKVTAEKLMTFDICEECHCAPECLCVQVMVREFESAADPACLGTAVICSDGPGYDDIVWSGTVELSPWGKGDEYLCNEVGDIDITVTLKSNEYGQCLLELSGDWLYDLTDCTIEGPGDSNPKLIDVDGVGCPDAVNFTFCGINPAGNQIEVFVRPAECDDCLVVTSPCCGRYLPDTLYATISGETPACANCDGEVAELKYVPGSRFPARWSGTFPTCGEVTLECDRDSLSNFWLEWCGGWANDSPECDPLYLEFWTGGCAECYEPALATPIVTVTE